MQPTLTSPAPAVGYTNTVRIGYARVSGRAQDHQMQLDALAAAHCRKVIVETASTRGARPKLQAAMDSLKPGDTLVIYKPDRIARSMKELLVLLEDELHAREVNLEILTGICAGTHKPNGQTIADKMLFMVAAMAAEMERDLIHERTMDGLAAAEAQGRAAADPPRSTTTPSPSPAPAKPRRIRHRYRPPPGHRTLHPLSSPRRRHHAGLTLRAQEYERTCRAMHRSTDTRAVRTPLQSRSKSQPGRADDFGN